jgi:hypothetical protein
MKRIIVRVIARHDAADDFAIVFREKQCRVAVFIERMTFSIEKRLALDQQRRDPGWIVAINLPGKFNEGIAVLAGDNLRHCDL